MINMKRMNERLICTSADEMPAGKRYFKTHTSNKEPGYDVQKCLEELIREVADKE